MGKGPDGQASTGVCATIGTGGVRSPGDLFREPPFCFDARGCGRAPLVWFVLTTSRSCLFAAFSTDVVSRLPPLIGG
eukprot:2954120-Amphidinium_carterae.1